ncbi:MAG: extensin-like domain-containing protein [Roseinatronobacter sp.]
MGVRGILLAGIILGVLVGCGSDRRSDQTASTVRDTAARDQPGLISRLNPIKAVFRGGPSRAVTAPRASRNLCGIRGLEGEVIPPVTSAVAGCGVAAPVRVTSVDGVRLSQGAVLDCETAAALHRWVRTGVKPAVGRSGGGVAQLQVAAHYVCRPRNNIRGAPVSEHGRGRAIDISGLQLADGTRISVRNDWQDGQHARKLQRMYRAACGPFGTTLGPGSDGRHEAHFHFDTARHRNGPICR